MAEKRLALLIGNAEYQHGELRKLYGPHHDVQVLEALLARPEIGGYQTQVVVDGTKNEVERAIDRLLSDGQRDDTALIFFAGHGLKRENGKLYFAVADTDPEVLGSTAVSAGWLAEQMQDSRVGFQIVLLDCCFGGAFAVGNLWRGDQVESGISLKVSNLEQRGRGQVVITAADSMQFALEGGALKEGQSPASHFTRVLVDGLKSGDADIDGDGKVTVDELMRYLEIGLENAGSPQRPTKWIFGAVGGDLLFAYNPLAQGRAEPSSKSDKLIKQQQILDLASRYETIRRLVPRADPGKTREMEDVIKEMKTLALAGLPLLAELTNSPSPGKRLAAVVILQEQPNLVYLDWLAARLAEDPGSFHGYHAAVALLNAARAFGASNREALKQAIEIARKSERSKEDAFGLVDQAERELLENPQ
jgi:Caspase domain